MDGAIHQSVSSCCLQGCCFGGRRGLVNILDTYARSINRSINQSVNQSTGWYSSIMQVGFICVWAPCVQSSRATAEATAPAGEPGLFSETCADWTFPDKIFSSSGEILDKGQQDNNYLHFFFFYIRSRVLSVCSALCSGSPHNLMFSAIKSKRTPRGSPATLPFLSFFLSFFLSLSQVHALSVAYTATDWQYWHVLGHLAARQMELSDSLQHLPGPHYPTHLWAQQIIVGIKHSCVKQQASYHKY